MITEALALAGRLVAAVERLADAAEALAARTAEVTDEGPVKGREAIAEAWGVSPSTVDEVIGACPPEQRPPSIGTRRKRYWFESASAARAWFAEAQAAKQSAPTKGRKQPARRALAGPAPAIDLRAVAREAIAARGGG